GRSSARRLERRNARLEVGHLRLQSPKRSSVMRIWVRPPGVRSGRVAVVERRDGNVVVVLREHLDVLGVLAQVWNSDVGHDHDTDEQAPVFALAIEHLLTQRRNHKIILPLETSETQRWPASQMSGSR